MTEITWRRVCLLVGASLAMTLPLTGTAAVSASPTAQGPGATPSAQAPRLTSSDVTVRARDLPRPEPRVTATKPQRTTPDAGQSRTDVMVKFSEGSALRLRGSTLVRVDPATLPQGTEPVRTAATPGELSEVRSVLARYSGTMRRLHNRTENQLDSDITAAAAADPARVQSDLNLWHVARVGKNGDAAALSDALNRLDVVEIAYPAPLAAALPVSPDFRSRQLYRGPANAVASGIDATYAWTIPGGTGANVRVLDIEYNWNASHEDLSKLATALVPNGTPDWSASSDHGTAVAGQIVGDNNTYGVTGLVPDSTFRVTNSSTTLGYNMPGAVSAAAASLAAGDVMLIEQQIGGPNGTCRTTDQVGCVPVEYDQATFDAIVNATSRGIIVVEAAGNGRQNLDSAVYGNRFSYSYRDSGAILVGAGGSGMTGCQSARSRMDFSNYGSRVDVQAWGECVTTTGYGDLYAGAGPNTYYTHSFAGTSSASPIVASAAASLSSIARQRGYTLSARNVRYRLYASGTPQTSGLAGNIGPLPNLRAAIGGLSGTRDTTAPSLGRITNFMPRGGVLQATTVPVTLGWSATDPSGVAAYAVYLRANGGAWAKQTLPSPTTTAMTWNLTTGSVYEVAFAAQDGAGNWSGYGYSARIGIAAFQENSTYVTRSGGWSQTAWASALGGYLSIATSRGATTSFRFTGTNVAWVGTKATNRGQASIYIDGVFRGTIDLYSSTTRPRGVIGSWSWSAPGTHTIQVVVEGTVDRPKVDVDAFALLG